VDIVKGQAMTFNETAMNHGIKVFAADANNSDECIYEENRLQAGPAVAIRICWLALFFYSIRREKNK
jgi:hypothetical protein